MSAISLPYISLQPSTSQVLQDVADSSSDVAAEDIWVSFYRSTQGRTESHHGRVRVCETDEPGQVDLGVRDGHFAIAQAPDRDALRVSCEALSLPDTDLVLPARLSNVPRSAPSTGSASEEVPAPSFYSAPNGKDGVACFAISNDRRRLVVGSRDGQCRVVEIVQFDENGVRKREKGKEVALRGHVGDLTAVEFFPSNEVVLTASSDMSLRVFSTADGSCPRHLQGHTKRVTGIHILVAGEQHKGREVLSSSMDGTIRLWDLSTGQETHKWTLTRPISSFLVISPEGIDSDENVLGGKFAVCGHPDGSSTLVSLSPPAPHSPSPAVTPLIAIFKTRLAASSVETLAYNPKTRLLATGTRSGLVSLFPFPRTPLEQLSQLEVEPMCSWRRTEGSSVSTVRWSERNGGLSLLVAGSDGLPYRASIDYEDENGTVNVRVLEEFVGLNCDSCSGILETEDLVWTSGGIGDGGIRIYDGKP